MGYLKKKKKIILLYLFLHYNLIKFFGVFVLNNCCLVNFIIMIMIINPKAKGPKHILYINTNCVSQKTLQGKNEQDLTMWSKTKHPLWSWSERQNRRYKKREWDSGNGNTIWKPKKLNKTNESKSGTSRAIIFLNRDVRVISCDQTSKLKEGRKNKVCRVKLAV